MPERTDQRPRCHERREQRQSARQRQQRQPLPALAGERPHDDDQQRQQTRRALRPERERGRTVEPEPRARPATREPPALPQGDAEEQRQQHVRHGEARVHHEALRGRDNEAGAAAGVGAEHVARGRVDDEREGDRGRQRGHERRERADLPDRPRDEGDQPGEQQRLVLIDDAVELGKPHVAAREDVAREQREARLVVRGEDDGAEIEGRHQRRHGGDDDERRRETTRHGRHRGGARTRPAPGPTRRPPSTATRPFTIT